MMTYELYNSKITSIPIYNLIYEGKLCNYVHVYSHCCINYYTIDGLYIDTYTMQSYNYFTLTKTAHTEMSASQRSNLILPLFDLD